ncbi:phage major capsid protein, HK97 family [Sphingomonas laterariae]|uniref:Phage major capsid protein, HK97 family n=2 Tax=Edaphosphingomonas laterariae TaxID=861865 RepID=A0A239C934_9SPHN|nr:phage major capsid protein, HK97 family [Sphingomonas laterariae]
MDGTYEVKADPLEASFDAVGHAGEIAKLRGELAAMKARIEAQAAAAGRPLLAGTKADASPERRAFVDGYLRKGVETGTKSFAGTTPGEGGYAIPREIDEAIDGTLKAISPIRAIANVVKVGSAGYRKLVTTGGIASGWAAETGARGTTATPSFAEIVPPMGDLYANPAASQAMLDDARFDVEGWLAQEIATEFARAEGAAFINGNGTDKPRGLLAGPITNEADGLRAFGTLQYVASGGAGAFASTNPHEKLIDLVQSLRSPYRQGACFVMNSATLAAIRKFKTADGAFLWQPALAEGRPDTLLGYPVVEAEDMPDITANSHAIAFGNFRSGYLITERAETLILRDPFTNKPFVHFYAAKRVGGAVSNSEAIKLMKFAAS